MPSFSPCGAGGAAVVCGSRAAARPGANARPERKSRLRMPLTLNGVGLHFKNCQRGMAKIAMYPDPVLFQGGGPVQDERDGLTASACRLDDEEPRAVG